MILSLGLNVLVFCSLLLVAASHSVPFSTEDIFVPPECESIAKPGDHILLEYNVLFANGSSGASLKQPSQLYHVLLASTVLTLSFYLLTAALYKLVVYTNCNPGRFARSYWVERNVS